MEGRRISAQDLKARWAFSEMRAERWRDYYAELSSDRIRDEVPFEQLTQDEKSHLVAMLSRNREHMAPELDRFETYECQSLSKNELARVYTIIVVSPDGDSNIPFLSYVAAQRTDDFRDPRVQADRIPFQSPFVQSEPVIILPYGDMPLLLDGYLRATLFMRSPNPDARILAWRPVS
jgi:hypothetical protein